MQYALNISEYAILQCALQFAEWRQVDTSIVHRTSCIVPSPVWRCFQATLVEPDMAKSRRCASDALDAVRLEDTYDQTEASLIGIHQVPATWPFGFIWERI